MQQMLEPYDDLGNRLPPLCTFYAYCLMSNHVHLLIKTHYEDIGATIKHLLHTGEEADIVFLVFEDVLPVDTTKHDVVDVGS